MSPLLVLAVGVIGGLGAIARYLLDAAVSARTGRSFPFGTLAVNLLGAFVLGVLVGAAVRGDAYLVVGSGALGAFTTFSTWALESHRLGEDGRMRLGAVNFAVSLVLGLLVAWAGHQVGGAV